MANPYAQATFSNPTMGLAHGGAFNPFADQCVQGNVTFNGALALLGALAFLQESASDNIVAKAGGTQPLAVPLVSELNRLTTVASAGDSVMLPPSQAGLTIFITNHGASSAQVYGSGTDTIDDVATATGVAQMANSTVLYTCFTPGKWYTEGLATGWGAAGLQTLSSQDSLTAKSGGGQGGGPTINRMMNRVTTVAAGNDSVTLPLSVAGMQITVINAAAANSMNVFPGVGDAINALGANAAFAVAANKIAQFNCVTAGQWHSILTA